jgi:hypothetical protein
MSNDKLDALFQQARRAGGQKRSRQTTPSRPVVEVEQPKQATSSDDRQRLILIMGRDGRHHYLLDGAEVRVGDPVEIYIDPERGWIGATFQWTGRERHPPSVLIQTFDPNDPSRLVGTLDATLPPNAPIRRP